MDSGLDAAHRPGMTDWSCFASVNDGKYDSAFSRRDAPESWM
jgi:hypothetical protein